jgi:hypothetical protein
MARLALAALAALAVLAAAAPASATMVVGVSMDRLGPAARRQHHRR